MLWVTGMIAWRLVIAIRGLRLDGGIKTIAGDIRCGRCCVDSCRSGPLPAVLSWPATPAKAAGPVPARPRYNWPSGLLCGTCGCHCSH